MVKQFYSFLAQVRVKKRSIWLVNSLSFSIFICRFDSHILENKLDKPVIFWSARPSVPVNGKISSLWCWKRPPLCYAGKRKMLNYKSFSKQRLESSPPERKFHDTITKQKLKTFSDLKWGKCCKILDLGPLPWSLATSDGSLTYKNKQVSLGWRVAEERSSCCGYWKTIRLHNWQDECGSEDKRWSQEFREDRSFS